MVGTTLGSYQLVEQLGEDPMGWVYKAFDPRHQRTVSLRIYAPDTPPHIIQSASDAATLTHPNIIAVYEVGPIDGRVVLVMEFVEGEPLAMRLQRGPTPQKEALSTVLQLASALDTVHRHDFVHRGVQPGNVICSSWGAVQLVTLDVAPAMAVAGGVQQDLWALGQMSYEMLTGRLPFSPQESASRYAGGPSGTILQFPEGTYPEFSAILQRLLDPEPRARYRSASDVWAALQQVAQRSVWAPASAAAASDDAEDKTLFDSLRERLMSKRRPGRKAAPTEPTPGQIIDDQYELLDRIGAGGMGVVFLAEDTRLQRKAAIKFLPASFSTQEEAKQRFILEARAASALDHPNIGTIYEIGETADGHLFISMAYYAGETIFEKVKRNPLPLTTALDYAIQTSKGLTKAHQHGIIHRDIKPSNLIVTEDDIVKILDFGLAKTSDVTITKVGASVGTYAYMSPEQTRGENVGPRADVWSLGVVFYEMLAGRMAFGGKQDYAVMYAVLNEDPPPLAGLRNDLPPEIEGVIRRVLAKDPAQRYASAEAFRTDLLALQAGQRPAAVQVAPPSVAVTTGPPDDGRPSVAVLPLQDLSQDQDQGYFVDGIAEDLIYALARVEGLRVLSRSSTAGFRDHAATPQEIARKLGVRYLLGGSVRKGGDQLRVSVQLLDAEDGAPVWAERYDRAAAAVFAIQDEITLAIVEALKVQLLKPVAETGLTKRFTDDIEAFQIYLKGRHAWNKQNKDGLDEAVQQFNAAVQRDPRYARAFAGLADAYNLYGYFNILPPRQAYPQAKQAAQHALSLDPNLVDGFTAMGFCHLFYDWDWPGAQRQFEEAVRRNPGHPAAHHWYAYAHLVRGEFDAAMDRAEKALALDPLSLSVNTTLGVIRYMGRRYDGAIDALVKTLNQNDKFLPALLYLGLTYTELGQYSQAVAAFQRGYEISKEAPIMLGFLGYTLGRAGKEAAARKIVTRLRNYPHDRYLSSFFTAIIHVGRGDADAAIPWLMQAYQERDAWISYLRVMPAYDVLRNDPRFQVLQQQVGA